MLNLDEHDYKFLERVKRGCMTATIVSRQSFIDLWYERTFWRGEKAIEYWTRHWLELNETYQWFSTSKLTDMLAPHWSGSPMYHIYGEESNFWDKTFSAIASILMLTEVRHIPGYREWINHKTFIPSQQNEEAPLSSNEMYGNGSGLPELHEDPITNREIQVQALCSRLDIARQVLGEVSSMQVVEPKLQRLKANAVWALDETSPTRVLPRTYRSQTVAKRKKSS